MTGWRWIDTLTDRVRRNPDRFFLLYLGLYWATSAIGL
jgi:hypothetical protein